MRLPSRSDDSAAFHAPLPVPSVRRCFPAAPVSAVSHRRPRTRHAPHVVATAVTAAVASDTPELVISHFEAAALLSARRQTAAKSTDMLNGDTRTSGSGDTTPVPIDTTNLTVNLGRDDAPALHACQRGIWLAAGHSSSPSADQRGRQHQHPLATWQELEKACKRKRTGAFELFGDGRAPARIAAMSATSGRALSLQPVTADGPPTLVVGGFAMHRVVNTCPAADTAAKIRAARPRGRVLDICTGLGYTAIAAASVGAVRSVTTVELDEGVVAIQRRNPWSDRLFTHETAEGAGDQEDGEGEEGGGENKLRRVVANAVDFVAQAPDGEFDCVIHDPPARVLGGDLFSAEMYRQIARVLRRGGRLFHYIGDPSSKESGRLYGGVRQRLTEAGFEKVRVAADAFGITAVRSSV